MNTEIQEFMLGFKDYVDRELRPELFSRRTFDFAPSTSDVFLQVADFVSGSFARCFRIRRRSHPGPRRYSIALGPLDWHRDLASSTNT